MATPELGRTVRWSLAFFLLGMTASLRAGEPEIRTLDVRGLQIGGTTTLIVEGEELGVSPKLLLPFPVKQTLKPGATGKRAIFEVSLDDGVQPGYHHLRVTTDGGVSLPVVIGVDRLPQRPLTPAVDRLPVALHGVVSGSTVVSSRFSGKAKQIVQVEVEAQRLGSRLRPIIHLYDPKRRQVAWTWGKPGLSGDARLQATLPADGDYTVSVHDAEYAGAAPGFFRLKIGQWSFVDQVFPPVVGKDQKSVELLGPAAPLRVELPAVRDTESLPLAWPKEGAWSGPRPFVRVSSLPEIVSSSDGKVLTLPAGDVGVSGRLLTPFAEDRYRIPVQPGSKVRLEAFAERLGSPLAVALVVRNDAGAVLARAEESPAGLDPVLEYTVPAKTTSILVGVADVQGQGGPRGVYRLTVGVADSVASKTDFRLFTPAQRITLPVGGRSVVPVLVERRGYQGSIALLAESLPAGVKLAGQTIPAGADGTLVTIDRGSASGAAVTHWRGRAEDGQERPVILQGHPLERLQPWMATELALAGSKAKAADFQIDWRNLPADSGLVLAKKLPLPVKLTRPAVSPFVRLVLLSSQVAPLLNNQPDPRRSLRQEKPVELAAKLTDGEVAVLVPPELAGLSYDVAVQADLLAADRRTVLATAFTPVRRLAVRVPLVLRIEGPSRIEVKRDPKSGARFEIKGKIERSEGLTGDVTVSLTGLPPGGQAVAVNVKANAADFTVKVVLPANVPAGEVKGLKLSGLAAAAPGQPGVRIRSRDVDLTLAIQSGGK